MISQEEVVYQSGNVSQNNSIMSMKDVLKGSSTDDSGVNRYHNSSTDLSSKMGSKDNSKVKWM